MTTLVVLLSLPLAMQPAAPPAKGRDLTAEEKKEVARLEQHANRKLGAAEFDDALTTIKQIAEYRAKRQGHNHWEAINARWNVKTWQRPAQECAEVVRAFKIASEARRLKQNFRYREAEEKLREALAINQKILGELHPDTAASYNNLALCLESQDKYAEALPLLRKALAIKQGILGEQHPDTATSYNNVAYCLSAQGKHGDALPLFQKALATKLEYLGDLNPATATSYNNVGMCLIDQGKYVAALPLLKKAFVIRKRLLGELDPSTAESYSNLAICLDALANHAEALPLHQKALAIRKRVLGELSPSTATSYNNLAICLSAQGRQAEALPLCQNDLTINLMILGEQHSSTATSYNNVAFCLNAQGKHAEALPLYQKALGIRQKVLGEQHPHTSQSYNNVACCVHAQGKHGEALPLFENALASSRKSLGEHHPETAKSHSNLASCLDALGRHSEALPHFQKSLAIFQKALGQLHPDTAQCYTLVAICFYRLGKYVDATRNFEAAVLGHDFGRLRATGSGFGRALLSAECQSPRVGLADCMVRLGKPLQAWEQAESALARGLLDDLLPWSDSESDLEKLSRLSELDRTLIPLLTREKLSDEESMQRDILVKERDDLQAELARIAARRSRDRVLPLERLQKQIPANAAVVFWLDVGKTHLGCILRRDSAPVWVNLLGFGKEDAWADDDASLPDRTVEALAASDGGNAATQRLLKQLLRQRFTPLEPHLKGVRHLLIVPTGNMSAVPVEALTDRYLVSYIPSASVYARRMEKHRPLEASSLLVLADPVFTRTPPVPPAAPSHGLLVKAVTPGSIGARIGLVPGDVLMEYGDDKLNKPDELKPSPDERVAIKLWRDGKAIQGRVPGGNLGVVVDHKHISEALAEWRKQDPSTVMIGRGDEWQTLPGTRLEARTLAGLIPKVEAMLGSDASEQRLEELATTGKLKDFRILHLATHGVANRVRPELTALILSQDRLPTPSEAADLVLAGKKPPEGKLTVQAILKHWDLDADLVVLSACQTGLGKQTSGEGMLGFTQALMQKGARTVVLSRWKVDDAATSLLMARFYENLLGKRNGLKEPMKRAEALAEAKKWLRQVPRGEAEKRLATLVDGVPRGERGSIKAALPSRKSDVPEAEDRPFAHAYYWAAFVLIGDPH